MSQSMLIVDDEEMVRDVLARFFESAKFDIYKAENVLDALKILETAEVDVVISDFRMPGMTGTEFLTIVRQKFPDTVRILYTAYANLNIAITAINEGEVFRLFTKPCNFSELYIAVQQALEQKGKFVLQKTFPYSRKTNDAESKESARGNQRFSENEKTSGGYQLRQLAGKFA